MDGADSDSHVEALSLTMYLEMGLLRRRLRLSEATWAGPWSHRRGVLLRGRRIRLFSECAEEAVCGHSQWRPRRRLSAATPGRHRHPGLLAPGRREQGSVPLKPLPAAGRAEARPRPAPSLSLRAPLPLRSLHCGRVLHTAGPGERKRPGPAHSGEQRVTGLMSPGLWVMTSLCLTQASILTAPALLGSCSPRSGGGRARSTRCPP